MTHASDIQERMFNLMMEIDDTKPLPPKVGRLHVAVNVLAQEIVSVGVDDVDDENDGWETLEETMKWAKTAVGMLFDAIENLGHPDYAAEFKAAFLAKSADELCCTINAGN